MHVHVCVCICVCMCFSVWPYAVSVLLLYTYICIELYMHVYWDGEFKWLLMCMHVYAYETVWEDWTHSCSYMCVSGQSICLLFRSVCLCAEMECTVYAYVYILVEIVYGYVHMYECKRYKAKCIFIRLRVKMVSWDIDMENACAVCVSY